MSPATHAVLGAAIAGATRRSWLGLWLAVPLAFLSHFLCDAIYHFEAFYPLSRTLGTTHYRTAVLTFVVIGLAVTPTLWFFARRNRALAEFYVYVAAATAAFAFDDWRQRAAAGLLLAGLALLIGGARTGPWVAGAFAAQLPDLIRQGVEPLSRLHVFMHYTGTVDLGEWLYRLFERESDLNFDVWFENPYYLAGYLIEVLVEVGIGLGSVYYLSRRRGDDA